MSGTSSQISMSVVDVGGKISWYSYMFSLVILSPHARLIQHPHTPHTLPLSHATCTPHTHAYHHSHLHSLQVALKWRFSVTHSLLAPLTSSCTVVLGKLLSLLLQCQIKDPCTHYKITCGCECSYSNSLSVILFHGLTTCSWLYNFFISVLHDKIKKSIENSLQVCEMHRIAFPVSVHCAPLYPPLCSLSCYNCADISLPSLPLLPFLPI